MVDCFFEPLETLKREVPPLNLLAASSVLSPAFAQMSLAEPKPYYAVPAEEEEEEEEYEPQIIVKRRSPRKPAQRKKKKDELDESKQRKLAETPLSIQPAAVRTRGARTIRKEEKAPRARRGNKKATIKAEPQEPVIRLEDLREAAPEARVWLRSLEPTVMHLGKISYRVYKVTISPPDENQLAFMRTAANIHLKSLAQSILNRSKILTIAGEAERAHLHEGDPTFRSTQHFPLIPIKCRSLPIHHRVLEVQTAVKIGEDNIYLLYRMQGDRCIYDTFFFLEDVIQQSFVEKRTLALFTHQEVPDWESVDWTRFEQ